MVPKGSTHKGFWLVVGAAKKVGTARRAFATSLRRFSALIFAEQSVGWQDGKRGKPGENGGRGEDTTVSNSRFSRIVRFSLHG
jgi:hypothetical protein